VQASAPPAEVASVSLSSTPDPPEVIELPTVTLPTVTVPTVTVPPLPAPLPQLPSTPPLPLP
jgi:hypothetical protein